MSSSQPLVTVVIPHYNSAAYLESALVSVRNQTYRNIEIVVVDDASTAEQAQQAAAICARFEVPFYQLEQNSGPSKARNEGIVRSRGDWLLFLDADDLLTPHSIACRMKRATPGCLWVTGFMWRVPETQASVSPLAVLRGAFFSRSNIRNGNILRTLQVVRYAAMPKPWANFGIHANMFAREAFKRYGLFDEELRRGEDSEFGERLQLLANIDPARCSKVVALYRQHPQQTIRQPKSQLETETKQRNLQRRKAEGIHPGNTRCYPDTPQLNP